MDQGADAKALQAQKVSNSLIDGHTHIDQYEPAELAGLLSRASDAGIGMIIAAGTTIPSCEAIQGLAEQFSGIRAGVGLHPADLTDRVDISIASKLRSLAQSAMVVEISETGLDYLPSSPPWEMQQESFRHHIRIAKDLGLPLVVHTREAEDDTLRLLNEEGASEVGGAWHYFQGTSDLANRAMELGFYISLAKPLLRLPDLQATVASLPLDRIVIETDSYPQPFKKHRDRWTEPWHLPQVANKIAEIHERDLQDVIRITTDNYLRMLNGKVERSDLGL